MQIWVDAVACPGEIKELLFRAAKRTKTKVTLVANQHVHAPRSEFIGSLLVGAEMNAADRRIVELVEPGDLVITADIPLAADVVAKGAQALNPRGELYTNANIGDRVAVRDLLKMSCAAEVWSREDQLTLARKTGKRLRINSTDG